MKVNDLDNAERDIYGIMVEISYDEIALRYGNQVNPYLRIRAYDYDKHLPVILKKYYDMDKCSFTMLDVWRQAEKLDKLCHEINLYEYDIFDLGTREEIPPEQIVKKEELIKRKALLYQEFETVLRKDPERVPIPLSPTVKPTRKSKGRR